MADETEDLDALFDSISDSNLQGTNSSDAPTVVVANTSSEAVPHSAVLTPGPPGVMFDRLGGIVRVMHDSMRELGYDKALSASAEEITNAQDRLAYIATLTEQAANKVLNAIDLGMPAQTKIAEHGKQMHERWKAMLGGALSIDEFKALVHDSLNFSATVAAEAEEEKARLLEIMMAQDFQDITGQIIKKVIIVTSNVEKELTQLLLDSAPEDVKERLAHKAIAPEKPVDLLSGPDTPVNAMAQDGVDDLLDSLGF